jgi:hypothetical protein
MKHNIFVYKKLGRKKTDLLSDAQLNSDYNFYIGGETQLYATFSSLHVSALIYDTDIVKAEDMIAISNFSKAFRTTQQVLLSQHIPIISFQKLMSLRNVVALQSSCTALALGQILEKIVRNEKVRTERSPRFQTDQPVRMMVMRSGLLIPTRMKNYSAGGAFLEYNGISLSVGDKIQIGIEPQRGMVKETQQLRARVVWLKGSTSTQTATSVTPITDAPGASTVRGVGVQFVSTPAFALIA